MSVEESEIEVEVPTGEAPSEVEVDLSENEKPVQAAEQEEAPSPPPEEDYSNRVQKRISQEVAKRHEADRRAAAAEERLIKLQQAYEQAQDNALTSGTSAIEAQRTALRRDYDDAYNSGDTDKMFEVQDKLSRLSTQQSEMEKHKADNERYRTQQTQAQQQTPPQAHQQAAPQQQAIPAEPEPKAVEWARKNKWFGQDEAMTGAAYAIHNRLVNTENYDTTSDDYFKELDTRLKSAFPSKFSKQKSNSSPVAAVTGRGATSKRVKLNQAQLDVCKKLGVTPEQYARYVDA